MTEYFAKRKISVAIQLAEGDRGENAGEVTMIEGRRCALSYLIYNGWLQGELQLSIWGLPLTMINKLTVLGVNARERRNNVISVYVGDDGAGNMSLLYRGTIWSAYGDFQGSPENVFHILALSAAFEAVKPSETRTSPGEKDVAEILQVIADEMNLAFENNLTEPVKLRDRHYDGDVVTQIKEICQHAGIEGTIERGVLAIWPRGGARKSTPVIISPKTGMVGYPVFCSNGVIATTIFNPTAVMGGKAKIESSLDPANGDDWNIVSLAHQLASEMPGGPWFTQYRCQRLEV